ncbi:MAG: Ku protein [Acidobacteria bacterium]|nr:Ku protein [Acidobacteriota bacterium]
MRSIWKGAISFLLVSIPVKVYNAIETSEKIQFNQLHGDDFGPIGYEKRCKKCNLVVSSDQIVKGYQHAPEQYVVVSPEEIASITPESNQSIEIIGFLKPADIPTTYFDASYFAAPDGAAATKAYTLLREVMKRTERIAIGKVILREREELIAISPEGDGLILQKLHYRHEVRVIESVPGISSNKLTPPNTTELDLAENLVNNMLTSFAEIDTIDHFHSALKQLLETKAAGGTVEVKAAKTAAAPVIDIMSALQASLNARPKPKANETLPSEPSAPTLTLVSPPAVASKKKKKTA